MSNYPPGMTESDIPGWNDPYDGFDDWADEKVETEITQDFSEFFSEHAEQLAENFNRILYGKIRDHTLPFKITPQERNACEIVLTIMIEILRKEKDDDLWEEYKEQVDTRGRDDG